MPEPTRTGAPADPTRVRAALAELRAIERDTRNPLTATVARMARLAIERRLTSPADAGA